MYAPLYFEIPTPMGNLDFAPGSYVGRTRLGYASGSPAHGLGNVSVSMIDAAESDGWAASDLNLLDSVGATDQDIASLMNGNITLNQLYAKYGVTIDIPSSPAQSGGSISSAMMQNAIAAGVSPSDLNLLNSVGATDNDIADLLNGTITLQALYAEYGVSISGVSPTHPSLTPPTAQAALPGGSTFIYDASWTAGVSNLFSSANSVISQMQAALSGYGMSVTSSSVESAGPIHFEIQLHVLDSVGHGAVADAKSVLDSLMHKIVGTNLSGSSISTTSVPGGTPSGGIVNPNAPIDWSSWLQKNAIWVGVFVGAVAIGPKIIKKL